MIKIDKDDIYILVRSFNEGEVILDTLGKISNAGFDNILFIDDGSTDNTKNILDDGNIELFVDNFIYLRHSQNRGAGAALETGFEYLRRNISMQGKYVVTFDADGQHDIDDIYNFIDAFESNNSLDIVFGTRFSNGNKSNIPFLRRVVLLLGKVFTFFISRINLTDSHNGYRMIKLSILSKLKLTMGGMEYASELIDLVSKYKLNFVEVPVNIKYTDYSIKKGQSSLNAINIVLKIIWNKFFK